MKKFFLTLSLACALVLTSQLPGSQSLATANTYGDAYFMTDEYDYIRPLDITRGGGGLFVRPLPTYQPVVSKNIILTK